MESQICVKHTIEMIRKVQKEYRNDPGTKGFPTKQIFNKPDFHASNLANETHVGYEKHLSGQKKRV